jgi:hypothetical protein
MRDENVWMHKVLVEESEGVALGVGGGKIILKRFLTKQDISR